MLGDEYGFRFGAGDDGAGLHADMSGRPDKSGDGDEGGGGLKFGNGSFAGGGGAAEPATPGICTAVPHCGHFAFLPALVSGVRNNF